MIPVNKFVSLVRQDLNIDSGCFKLFYIGFSFVLLLSTAMICSSLCFGDPIVCHIPGKDPRLAAQYCYTHGSKHIDKKIQPTLKCFVESDNETDSQEINYYQWLSIVQILQAAVFLLPYLTWKKLEFGVLQFILDCKGKEKGRNCIFFA